MPRERFFPSPPPTSSPTFSIRIVFVRVSAYLGLCLNVLSSPRYVEGDIVLQKEVGEWKAFKDEKSNGDFIIGFLLSTVITVNWMKCLPHVCSISYVMCTKTMCRVFLWVYPFDALQPIGYVRIFWEIIFDSCQNLTAAVKRKTNSKLWLVTLFHVY